MFSCCALLHFGSEFVDVVLIISERVHWGERLGKEKDVMRNTCAGPGVVCAAGYKEGVVLLV